MGSLPDAELSLDFRPTATKTMEAIRKTSTFVPDTIRELLKELSVIADSSEKLRRLDAFVKGLKEEMRKIDAFKRELPLCVLLLNDAIVLLKEEIMQYREESKKRELVFEEFIPLKKNSEGDRGKLDCSILKKERDCLDKKNWMRYVQLWSSNDDDHCPSNDQHRSECKQNPKLDFKANKKENDYVHEDRCRNAASLYMPFKPYAGLSKTDGNVRGEKSPILGFSLSTPVVKNLKEESGSTISCAKVVLSPTAPNLQPNLRNGSHIQPPQLQTSRKQRRCWSPELHRRFVDALQQLGGCQAATPKQIKELMQVDGLTNDEVKSHLQKYRLHTRRMPSAAHTTANQSAGVSWMSQDQCGESSTGTSSQSGSPQGHLDLTRNTGTSTTGGDNMEDDEDAKSESYSCKSHIHRVV